MYVWLMELYGRQFRPMELNPGCMFGSWNYMVGSFSLWRSIVVYVWCMELYGRQFWSMKVNPVVFCCMELDGR